MTPGENRSTTGTLPCPFASDRPAAGRSEHVLFHRDQELGGHFFLTLEAGDCLLFYLVQDGFTAKAVTGKRGSWLRGGAGELVWEDGSTQGDRDFNDLVMTVRRA